jgi:uncharacterized protein (UPF0335 family)
MPHDEWQIITKTRRKRPLCRRAEALIAASGTAIVGAAAGGRHHNGDEGKMPDFGGIAGEQLKSLVERIERLEEEKRALGEDIKEVYAEAKGTGFEPKIMRQLIKIRKMDKDEHDEQESLLDLYQRAIGMLPDPTAQAAE